MRLGPVLALATLLAAAACGAYHEPPVPSVDVTTIPAPPITGTVVVQPQP